MNEEFCIYHGSEHMKPWPDRFSPMRTCGMCDEIEELKEQLNLLQMQHKLLRLNSERGFEEKDARIAELEAGLKSVEDATRTAPGDGSQHDTEESSRLIELLAMLCEQQIKDERINNFEELHGLARRARSFLKENGDG